MDVTDRESSVSLSEHKDTRLGSLVLLNGKDGKISVGQEIKVSSEERDEHERRFFCL